MSHEHARSPRLTRYVFAVAATALPALLRLAMTLGLGEQGPYFPFVLAVLVSAYYGGFRPGLLATAVGLLVGLYLSQPGVPAGPTTGPAVPFLFATIGLTSSLQCGALHAARRQAEQKQRELARAEEALKEADRKKNEFLAMLGHKLRNPLAPLRNGLSVLRLKAAAEPMVESMLLLMERQVTTLVRLVDDLLDVSRVTRGKIELRNERVNLAARAVRATESARPTMNEQGHRFEVDVPAEPVWAEADPTRIEQVVCNLLSNAARYTPPGGHVRLSLSREGDEAVVRVRDTGIGIHPEDLQVIWDTFRQAGRVEGRAPEGLGLGLTVVQRLVELHGGTVTVASEGRGKGSEFAFRLPVLP